MAPDRVVETREEMVDGGPPQLVLRVEVIVDLRLMRSGRRSDRTRRRALEAVGSELGQRGIEQCGSGRLRPRLAPAWHLGGVDGGTRKR